MNRDYVISRAETIAAVLEASDGHFGRIIEYEPWMDRVRRSLARVVQNTPYRRIKNFCVGSKTMCAISDESERDIFSRPRLTCSHCGRQVTAVRNKNGWQFAIHGRGDQ